MVHVSVLAVALYTNIAAALVVPDLQTVFNFNQFNKKPTQVVLDQVSESKEREGPVTSAYEAPLLSVSKAEDIVPDKYIVVFKDGQSLDDVVKHQDWINKLYQDVVKSLDNDNNFSAVLKRRMKDNNVSNFNVSDVLNGYFGFFTDDLIKSIRADNMVKYVEKDTKVKINEYDIQKDAPWGIARLSKQEEFTNSNYEYDDQGGEGVTAYVIDTGIKVSHPDFGGRALWGDSVAFPNLQIDGNGHGTHCAGIIGSTTYGVAKKVELVAVGVMNLMGTGTTSDIIKGIEFVVNDHKQKVADKKKGFKGSVINMSLGGPSQDALDLAINAATSAGIHVAVAAGNDDQDACNNSPAKASGPLTVGSTNIKDEKSGFSNWGTCVDIWAPGEDITSTYIFGDTTSMSGTSMASPHIAGLLSYFLSLQPEVNSEFSSGLLKPLDLKQKVIDYATKGVISGITDGKSPNLLAYNGGGRNLTDFWE